MTHRLHFAVALAVFVFAATPARHADACVCQPMSLAPPAGSTIPRNAPAFPFHSGTVKSVPELRLLDALGAERPTSVVTDPSWPTGSLLVPTTPLAIGAGYQIAYAEGCGSAGAVTRAFDVGPEAPLPTSIGPLTAANWAVGPAGGCAPPSPEQLVSIELAIPASPAMIAWAPTASFRVTLDGQEGHDIDYGRAQRSGDSFVVTRVSASCAADTWRSGEWTLGVHDITVRAHVAGAASDPPPVSVRLRLSCSDSNFDQIAEADDASIGANSAGAIDGGTGFGAANGINNSSNPKTDETVVAGCGCSTIGGKMGGASSSAGFGASALFAMAALVRLVRRARNPR